MIESLSLWSKLKQFGFTCKEITDKLSVIDKFKNLFGAKIKPTTRINDDWLIKTINGKLVEVYSIDIWYTQVRVDGKVIFDDRRFDDQDLLDIINEHTK